jgi:two-component system LytT family sensor kinase
MSVALKRRLREYGLSFLVWTVIGLYFFSQGLIQKYLSKDPTPWWHHLASWMTGSYVAAALTPTVLWLGRRFPFERQNKMRVLARHLPFSIAFASVHLTVESAILFQFGVFPTYMKSFVSTLIFLLMLEFHQDILTYWLMLGIQHAFRYYRQYQQRERDALRLELRTSELKAQLTRAHLSTLKMQLQPHFLFNTLNAIMVLVRQRKTEPAEEMLARLSDLLRCVLDEVETQEVPLRREFEYLRLYLSIEKVRFQDRLKIHISAAPDVLSAAFPHMGLQPLVENAIRHGIGRRSAAGVIRISAWRVDDTLRLIVQDDGPGFSAGSPAATPGIGLENTRKRLHQLYGEAGRLETENAEQGGALVTMFLPFRNAPDATEMEVMEVHAFDSINS